MLRMLGHALSPWSERVRWVLDLKRVPYEHKECDADDDEVRRLTGLGTLPILWDGDELIGDSEASVRWVEEHYPTPSLVPDDLQARMQVRLWEALATRAVAPCARLVSIGRFIELGFKMLGEKSAEKYGWSPASEAEAIQFLRETLHDTSRIVSLTAYLAADEFTRADITMACMLMPVLGPPPDELFSVPPGKRPLFGIPVGMEPFMEPLRAWRNGVYRHHRRPAQPV